MIGAENKRVFELKLAWEPARYQAFVNWNLNVDRRYKLKSPQQLIHFAWEHRESRKGDAKKAIMESIAFRQTVKDKWGLKYKND